MDLEPDQFSKPLDFFVIDKFFDPLTQRIQRNIGLDCFFWAKALLWIFNIVAILNLMILVPMMFTGFFVFMVTIMTGIFLLVGRHKLHCKSCGVDAMKENAYKEIQKGRRNPMVLNKDRLFLSFLFWTITIPFDVAQGPVMSVFLMCIKAPFMSIYIFQCLTACTPLPPRKSKLRKAFESLKEKASQALGGSPLPQPA